MFNIKEIKQKVDKIVEVYEKKIYPQLKNKSALIYQSLNDYLQKECKNRGISSSNSVYHELYPYSIIFREKKPDSLREKIVRNDYYNKIYDEDENKLIENIYKNINDLIGYTILVDTSRYLEGFHKILFETEHSEIKIVSNSTDPLKKIGDLTYYNLKADFKDENRSIKIEIQIKSAIVSAFTNLQHKLIYKNNRVMISKKNSDFMIKAITPAIVAVESVINTAESSIKTANDEKNDFNRKEIIQDLLHKSTNGNELFDSFIEKLDQIVARAYLGYEKYQGGNESLENFLEVFKLTENSLDKDGKYANSSSLLMSLLLSIVKIDKEFIKFVLFFDYYCSKKNFIDTSESLMRYFDEQFSVFLNLDQHGEFSEMLLIDDNLNIVKLLITTNEVVSAVVTDLEDLMVTNDITERIDSLRDFLANKVMNELSKVNNVHYEFEDYISWNTDFINIQPELVESYKKHIKESKELSGKTSSNTIGGVE